jgi:hypothetical protein
MKTANDYCAQLHCAQYKVARTQVAASRRVFIPHRLRLARWPEGAGDAGRNALGQGLQAGVVRRHRRIQPASLYLRLVFGRHNGLPGLVSGLTRHAGVR